MVFSRTNLLILLLSISSISGQYLEMDCTSDSDYVTDWDALWFEFPSSTSSDNTIQYLSGMGSKHSNSKEDRVFKFEYCSTTDSNFHDVSELESLDWTEYDETWTKTCSDGYGMIGIVSEHNNGKEDRIFNFLCAKPASNNAIIMFSDCEWSGYYNDWDDEFNFNCSNDGIITGINSTHSNSKQDRLYNFQCCRMESISDCDCEETSQESQLMNENLLLLLHNSQDNNNIFILIGFIANLLLISACVNIYYCNFKKQNAKEINEIKPEYNYQSI